MYPLALGLFGGLRSRWPSRAGPRRCAPELVEQLGGGVLLARWCTHDRHVPAVRCPIACSELNPIPPYGEGDASVGLDGLRGRVAAGTAGQLIPVPPDRGLTKSRPRKRIRAVMGRRKVLGITPLKRQCVQGRKFSAAPGAGGSERISPPLSGRSRHAVATLGQ